MMVKVCLSVADVDRCAALLRLWDSRLATGSGERVREVRREVRSVLGVLMARRGLGVKRGARKVARVVARDAVWKAAAVRESELEYHERPPDWVLEGN